MIRCSAVLFLFLLLTTTVSAEIRYVDKDSTAASPNGRSWASAYKNIQQGIDAVSAAGGGEVWVAEGRYNEARSQADGALVMRSSVSVYGGFAGTETTLNQRDFNAHPAYIDGSRSRGSGQPAYHVVLGANSARLDGFIIEGGNANGTSNDTQRCGGGIYNNGVSPQLANLVFQNLRASLNGGAMYNAGGGPNITACTFNNNTATVKGGAVFNTNSTTATFTNCTFSANDVGVAGYGGAVNNEGASPNFRYCVFTGNSGVHGGAVSNTSASPDSRNCTYTDNVSSSDGGAVYNSSASPDFTACVFTANEAGSNGGAVFGPGSATAFINCTFYENDAQTKGGAIYGNSAFAVMNCSFRHNQAATGGTLYNAATASSNAFRVTNSILWDGSPAEIANANTGSNATVTYSNVERGYSGTGNINVDPRYVGNGNEPLRLQPSSPCINQGTNSGVPTTDFSGATRIQGGTVDMGAFEGGSYTLRISQVTGSGTVNPASGVYHYYAPGAVAVLSATPAANWRFDRWTGGVTGNQNPVAVTMSGNRELQAVFIRQYKLTVQVTGTGTVSPSVGEHIYDANTSVPLSASPAAGWRFDHWEGDLTGTASTGSVTMSADRTVRAVFTNTYTLTMAVSPANSGTVSPAAGTHAYAQGATVPISATPKSGWRFNRWEGGVTGSTNPTSVTMSANKSVTAVFEPIPTYTLTVSRSGSGTTNPVPGTYTHLENTSVSITAIPDTDWAFDHWAGEASGSANPLTLTMNRNWSCQAVFRKLPLEVKTASPTAGLSIGGTAVTLEVQSWTDNCRVYLGGQLCRTLSVTGAGPALVRVAVPPMLPGAYALMVRDNGTSEESTADSNFDSVGDPFDARLSSLDSGFEVDDNNPLVTTYVRRVWRSGSAIPAVQYRSPDGIVIDLPSTAFPAAATGAFLLARIAAQPDDLFPGATPLPDYRLRSSVLDYHVYVQEPIPGGSQVRLLDAPALGTVQVTCPLTPGPLDPLLAGGFQTTMNPIFGVTPPSPAAFAEIAADHLLDGEGNAIFQLPAFGAVALFGDGPFQDVNDDGNVDATDLQYVVNAALGQDIGGLNADINGDGRVNAADVQLEINAYLGHW